jgi:hypothetical protein
MVWQQVRNALLGLAFTAAAAVAAHAEEAAPHAAGAPAPAVSAPQYRTVSVTEWVPETYPCTRTVHKMECRQETYTAYRTECVPETRTRVVTVCRQVPEVQTRTRTICVSVPCVEERTVMKTFVTCKPVTTMVRKCVDRGHYECREVPCGPSFRDRLRKCFHRNDCCCDACSDNCAPRTKTVRVWVPCPTWEEVPVTKMERVCETRPVTTKVTVCKKEMRTETYQVTVCKMVPEQRTETYTVNFSRCVPYQATRTVNVCVPTQETVTATRMVPRVVEKQVPVDICAPAPVCEPCCESSRRHGGLFSRRHGNDCCH